MITYLSEGEANKLASSSNVFVVSRNHGEHERSHQEALNLDPFAAEDLDGRNGDEVSRDVSSSGDDKVAIGALQQCVVLGLALGESYIGQQHGLIEVGAVERNVNEEPSRGSANEVLQMTPFGEVNAECAKLLTRSRLAQASFDDLSSRTGAFLILANAVVGGLERIRRRCLKGRDLGTLKVLARLRHSQTEVQSH